MEHHLAKQHTQKQLSNCFTCPHFVFLCLQLGNPYLGHTPHLRKGEAKTLQMTVADTCRNLNFVHTHHNKLGVKKLVDHIHMTQPHVGSDKVPRPFSFLFREYFLLTDGISQQESHRPHAH